MFRGVVGLTDAFSGTSSSLANIGRGGDRLGSAGRRHFTDAGAVGERASRHAARAGGDLAKEAGESTLGALCLGEPALWLTRRHRHRATGSVRGLAGAAHAELRGPAHVGIMLDAAVPSDWPPGDFDRGAVEFFRKRLLEGGEPVWYAWYAVAREGRQLVGSAGYFGPPDDTRSVEIGYSVEPPPPARVRARNGRDAGRARLRVGEGRPHGRTLQG